MIFADRRDAGGKLAAALEKKYKDQPCVVLALPRGGVPVAAEVAKVLKAPLDLILVRKIGVPYQPELAMGAVVDGGAPVIVRNESIIREAEIGEEQFQKVCKQELEEIERRRKQYFGDRAPENPEGRVAIVIDDGIATGATMSAALKATRARKPKTLVMAVPVAPADTVERMRAECDDVVCLDTPADFSAVGFFYRNFNQTRDEEVIAALKAAHERVTPSRA